MQFRLSFLSLLDRFDFIFGKNPEGNCIWRAYGVMLCLFLTFYGDDEIQTFSRIGKEVIHKTSVGQVD